MSSSPIKSTLPMRDFPPVINGRINMMEFLDASADLVYVLQRFGLIFAPVKFDLQRNIIKLKTQYKYDENSCLLELMYDERTRGEHIAIEGCLWLNRGLLIIELFFVEVIINLEADIEPDNMDLLNIFTKAYDNSLRQYHNMVTQALFSFICKMFPTITQMMNSLDMYKPAKHYLLCLIRFNKTLHMVRSKIDDFFKENNILDEKFAQRCSS